MKILVTGANGMVGHSIQKVFTDHQLILTDVYDLDVRNYKEVVSYIDKLNGVPDYVIHLAAETDLEVCELKPEQAFLTNHTGTVNMIQLARLLKIPIVYLSTAGVFRGDKRGYVENDTPDPVNVYGRSKYYGELAVRGYAKHYIFRMSWAMGGGEKLDRKFVNKIIQRIRRGDKVLNVVDDKWGSPTFTDDVAKTILNHLTNKTDYGTYHTAGKGGATRFEVAEEIVRILDVPVKVLPIGSMYYNARYFSDRATYEILIAENGLDHNCMREWKESLRNYLKEYYYA